VPCAGGGAGCPKAYCLLGLKTRLFRRCLRPPGLWHRATWHTTKSAPLNEAQSGCKLSLLLLRAISSLPLALACYHAGCGCETTPLGSESRGCINPDAGLCVYNTIPKRRTDIKQAPPSASSSLVPTWEIAPTPRQNISTGLGHTNPRLLHAEGRRSFLLVHGCASLTQREEEVSHIHLLSLLWKPVGDRYARRGALECAYVVQCVAGAYVCLFAVSWQARASLGV